ncbi:MAG: hypothetical protein R2882_08955 [Gemmatimonadales bacterium]
MTVAPEPPPRQVVGIEAGLAAYAGQSGVGASAPTQTSCDSVCPKPEAAWAAEKREVGAGLRKRPTPPRTTSAAGPLSRERRNQLKPTRGLIWKSVGQALVSRPNVCATAAFCAGAPLYRAPSARRP